jgi:hypothetical protein
VQDGGEKNAAPTGPRTVEKTVTLPATTVVQTITTAPVSEPAQTQPTETRLTETEPRSSTSATALNDEAYRKIGAGDYAGALPLLEQAVSRASGSGTLTEAYAEYNLALTRRTLGRCDGVLDLLDRSEQVQGRRKEIDRLRKDTEKAC